MKNNLRKIVLMTLFAGMAIPCFNNAFASTNQEIVETEAAVNLESYYAGVNTTSKSTLFSSLKTLTSGHKSHSYDDLWTTYKAAYVKADGYMFDYYSNTSKFKPGTDQAGNYSGEGDVYNREHSIPKSWWGGSESNQGADPFIVVPTDGYINNMRSNYAFGNVSSVSKQSNNGFSKLGSAASTHGYGGSTVFEPNDSVKGDFARIYFYAVTKWSAGGWTSGDGSKHFNNSTTNFYLTDYSVSLFKEWHEQDPVSDWERSVNDKIYPIFGIRNPYIDHPEYADFIWFGGSLESKELTSISITGTANKTSYYVGDKFDPTGLTVKATFDNNEVVTIGNSNITWTPSTLALNTSTITASYTYGNVTKTATYTNFTVKERPTISGLTYTGTPTKTTYVAGENFNPAGLTVTATYTDSTTEIVTNSVTWTPSPLTLGTTSVKGTLGNYSITVSGISVTAPAAGASYVKVTKALDDWSGQYLIVYEAGSKAFNGSLTKLDAANNNFSVTIQNNAIESTVDIDNKSFTIAKSGTSYTIKSASGYYIGATGNSNSLNSSLDQQYTNTITVDKITGSGSAVLRYNAGADQNRFRYYKSSSYTNQQAVALYKYEAGASEPDTSLPDAQAWATSFLSSVTCDGGLTKPSVANWNSKASTYAALSDGAKALLVAADYELVGNTVTAVGGTDQTIAEAVARYDYIVAKYGESTYQAFISGRDIQPLFSNNFLKLFSNNTGLIIFAIILGTSVCAFTIIYFVNKKRRYQK